MKPSDDEADVVSVIQEGASACSSLQLIGSVATIVMMVICVGYFRAALKRIQLAAELRRVIYGVQQQHICT